MEYARLLKETDGSLIEMTLLVMMLTYCTQFPDIFTILQLNLS